MLDVIEPNTRESALSELIQFVIEDADDWSEVALVALLRPDGKLLEVEKDLVLDIFSQLPNPADIDTIEALVERPFEYHEVSAFLQTCLVEGDISGAIGFSRRLNVTLDKSQLELVLEQARANAEDEE
jgi:hypothetical protein